MAKAYNARCLVIRRTKLGETDAIVTMLAQDGSQIRAVAKGLRKPGNRIGARLELFSEVDLLVNEGKSLDLIREVKTVQTHAALREDLLKTACAQIETEFIEKIGRDGVVLGARFYDMSRAALDAIALDSKSCAPLIACAFLIKAMAMQGYAPAVRECALCGSPIEQVRSFDIGYGGALCEPCISNLGLCTTLGSSASTWLESMLYCTFAELGKVQEYPVSLIIDVSCMWVREHAGIGLKSISFLKSILN